jgi:hypothetical protein
MGHKDRVILGKMQDAFPWHFISIESYLPILALFNSPKSVILQRKNGVLSIQGFFIFQDTFTGPCRTYYVTDEEFIYFGA